MNKAIAVILPVYNGGHLLRASIQSVLSQEYDDFEFLICDDCSKDDSLLIINEMCKDLPYVSIYQNECNLGLFKTLNRLLSYCSSPLIHLWSQDDVMKPTCLNSTILFHEKYPQIGMSYSGRDLIDGEGKLISIYPEDGTPILIDRSLYAKISSYWGCIAGNIANVTLTKSVTEQVGFFNEEMEVSGDFEYWTRIAEAEFVIGFNIESNIFLRKHTGQLSKQEQSIVKRINEDIPLMLKLIDICSLNDKEKLIKCWKWKTQTMYFNEMIYLLRRKKWILAKASAKAINQTSYLPFVGIRWILIRVFRLLNKEIWFYKRIINTLN